jgi:hypothetical protein
MSAAEPTGTTKRLQLIGMIAAGLAVGAAGTAGAWYVWLKPQLDDARVRAATLEDISHLFGLQNDYMKAKGVYADGLDALLSTDPGREAFKARLASHVDMSTLAVVGGPKKFKIEANALDKERTLIKLKGPVENRFGKQDVDIPLTEATSSAGGGYGLPVAPAPAAPASKPRAR